MENEIVRIEFTYRGIVVTIEKHFQGYCFYSEADNCIYRHYETRAEALDQAIIETDKNADFYVDLGF